MINSVAYSVGDGLISYTLPHKPLYDDCCVKSRKSMLKSRKRYRRDKNTENLDLVEKSSTKYKKIVHKAYSEHKNKLFPTLRLRQSENPKEYWKIIKGERKSEAQHKISLDLFKEHFEKLALGNESVNVSNTTDELHNMPQDTMLNRPFTHQEIAEAITKLKNNKAGGSDQIINKFLKHSQNEFVQYYTKFLNLILESGHMPADWCESVIRPIYKNKGDIDDPNYYRGISLLCCFRKLFTSCLNRRLTIFIERNNIVQAEQAGFKSDFSIIDHLFVLKSLADMYLSKCQRLYIAVLSTIKKHLIRSIEQLCGLRCYPVEFQGKYLM